YGPDSPFRHVDHEALHLHQTASPSLVSPLDSPPPSSPLVSVLHLRLLAPLAFPLHPRDALAPLRYRRRRRLGAPAPARVPSPVPPRSVSSSRLSRRPTRGCFVCPFPWLLAAPARTLPCPGLLGPAQPLRGAYL
ncbi:hypothetical protein PVAP13_4KG147415, partial [Panicum virgatum]